MLLLMDLLYYHMPSVHALCMLTYTPTTCLALAQGQLGPSTCMLGQTTSLMIKYYTYVHVHVHVRCTYATISMSRLKV